MPILIRKLGNVMRQNMGKSQYIVEMVCICFFFFFFTRHMLNFQFYQWKPKSDWLLWDTSHHCYLIMLFNKLLRTTIDKSIFQVRGWQHALHSEILTFFQWFPVEAFKTTAVHHRLYSLKRKTIILAETSHKFMNLYLSLRRWMSSQQRCSWVFTWT